MIWTDEEYNAVKSAFLGLAELHNFKLSELKVELYFRILQRFPGREVVQAIDIAMQTTKFFPKPAELVEIIMGSATDRAAIAWNTFLEIIRRIGPSDSVVFEDSRLSATVDYFGGWDEVHKWKTDELTWRRQEFIKIYASFRQAPPGRRHIGNIEHQNRARGFLDHIPKTVVIPMKGLPGPPMLPPSPNEYQPLLPEAQGGAFASVEPTTANVKMIASNLFGGPNEQVCAGNRSDG
jgi:hypothetical protein